ncbi:folate-binding protein [Sphingomonas sp. RB56-2]|uniref:Folate-binding protein n=1 Tax=Sphingomonas brevis TaxID=2908206 RepID=A0ABT0SBL5_9SPHN|nr:folate-binding protein [Sphingomonas brevis]MCL6741814.1 folate-binding protein [Sphingomonas brevis]
MPQNSPTATTLADRSLVRLSGDGVRDFLQGLVTQDVTGPLPVWAGLLTAQGKCMFDFLIWPDPNGDGDELLLDCEAEAADDLIKRLAIYRLRKPIKIERDDSLAVHWSLDGAEGADDPRLHLLGRRWLGPADGPVEGWLEHRLRLGVCEGRAELGDLLWLECNAAELNGVSFTKGCFVGQENTARMNWRQKVNRRLVVVAMNQPGGDGGDRARIAYPELGLAVVHARADAVPDNAIVPAWLGPAPS